MLVCTVGVHTGVFAFEPGKGSTLPGPDLTLSRLEITKNNSIANGIDENTVRVVVVDENNLPLGGIKVTFNLPGGVTQSFFTQPDGTYSMSFGSFTVGTVAVNVVIDGQPLNKPANTIFIAAPPTVNTPTTRLVVVANNALANNSAVNKVGAYITDAYGHPIAGQTVAFTIASGIASVQGSTNSFTTDGNGYAEISLYSAVAGTVTVTATMNGINIINNSPATVVFIADVPQTSNPLTALSVGNNHAVANNVATNSVRARIVDALGNPVPNATVVFTIASGTAAFSNGLQVISVTTGPTGIVEVNLRSAKSGSVNVTATVNNIPIVNGSPATVTFVADVPQTTNPLTALLVVMDNALANGTARNAVRATVRDANNNPVAGATIVFSIMSGTGTLLGGGTTTTNSSGVVAVDITSTLAGKVYVTATINGVSIVNGSPAIVTFVADVPQTTNPLTTLSVVDNNAVANGLATNSVKAHLVDAKGNPVPNATVSFTIASGIAEFSNGGNVITATTNANGDAVVTLTSEKAGQAGITATVNNVQIINGSPATVTFVADVPSVNVPGTVLVVVMNNALANGVAKNGVRATIVDANGNPVPNATVVFTIVSGTATIQGSNTVTTGPTGQATIDLRSTVAGKVHIIATVNGVNIVNGSPAIVTFVADVPQTTNPATTLSVVTNNALANGTATNSVKVRIVDANGNPVPNANIQFAIASGTADFESNPATTTGPNGEVTIPLSSTVAGSVNITATVNGVPIVNGSPATVVFVADVPQTSNPATALIVEVSGVLADGASLNGVRAHVVDVNGNPVPGATVEFSILSGTAVFESSPNQTTDPSGDAYVTLKSTVAGPVSIIAKVNNVPIVNGSPAIVIFTADAPNTGNPATALVVVTPSAVANGTAVTSVKAHIVDVNGNPVEGASIEFTIASGAANIEQNNPILTNASGDAVITLNSTVAGEVFITATVNGTPIVNGSPAKVVFTTDVPSTSNPATRLSVEVTGVVADGTSLNGVKAHVEDAQGNPIPNATIEFAIASGTGTFSGSATVITDANGDAYITLHSTVVGWVGITAKVNNVAITNGSPALVQFVADAPSTGNPATALVVVTPSAVADGTAVTSVKAHIVDVNGNPVEGASIEFTIASGAANIEQNNPILTNASGDAVITLNSTVAGEVFITATVNGTPIVNGSPAKVVFTTDVPSTSNPATRLSVEVTGVVADGASLNGVKAHVEDAQGNPIPNATIEFAIASGTGTFSGSATVITDANGDAYITLHSTVVGWVGITAKVNNVTITNGSPALVEFVADAPSTGNPATALVVVTPSAVADGNAVTSVKARIVDAYGNPVKDAEIVFSIASGTATIDQANPLMTGATGEAIITLRSTVVGEVRITATVNGMPIVNGSPAIVHFTAGEPAVSNPTTALIVVTDGVVANGTALNSVKAHIVDADGRPVANANVAFAIASGTATLVEANPVATDANGDAVVTLHSIVAGKVNITATVNNVSIVNGSPAVVTFVAGDPDINQAATAMTVLVDNAQANGTATNSVKVHIVDAQGNPVPGATIAFVLANGTATIVEQGPFTTNVDGNVIITLTSTVAGSVEISATVNTVAIKNGSPATLKFTADPDVSAPDTRLIVLSNNALSDGVETNSVKAHVVDATGTPLALKEVFFKIESGDATVLTVQPVLTDANGDATILLASKKAGAVSVTAKVSDKPIVHGSPALLRFVPIDIYVPKVFTPNNDGNNDVLKPIVVGLTTFHYFNVYNRWGNLVFSSKDPNMGWDGRFKGVLQPVETYLWIAEGLDKDKKKITRRGMVSLVR